MKGGRNQETNSSIQQYIYRALHDIMNYLSKEVHELGHSKCFLARRLQLTLRGHR